MADENDDAPEADSGIEQLEQAMEQLQELLAAAQDSLDELESAAQEQPDDEWLDEAEAGIEEIEGGLEQLAQARDAWGEKLTQVAESIGTEIGELQGAVAECAEHANTASSAAATSLEDLRELRGNRFEALKGDRTGQFSIRINDQFRICFRWDGNNAYEVEIADYH